MFGRGVVFVLEFVDRKAGFIWGSFGGDMIMMEKVLLEESVCKGFLGEVDADVAVLVMFNSVIDSQKISNSTIEIDCDFGRELAFKFYFSSSRFAKINKIIDIETKIYWRFPFENVSDEETWCVWALFEPNRK